MKYIAFAFTLICCFSLQAQDISYVPSNFMDTDTSTSVAQEPSILVTETSGIIAPTLWECADGMDGFDSYCVFKSMIDKQIYLIGFDSEGEQNLKLLIEQATFNEKLSECTVIYNGTKVRLRNRKS